MGSLLEVERAHPARQVVERLRLAGHEAFWVGGCVRDLLLGRKPGDHDIATSAKPSEIESLFERTVPVGRQFGVVIVLLGDCRFEVATFREEAGYRDGRRPDEIRFTNAIADARRRDFTINGLFLDPITGQVHDWVGGEPDLKNRIIRAIGSPTGRFREDHLRMLRAVRFAAQLGFSIEASTLRAVVENRGWLSRISTERIRDELIKLFHPAHAVLGLTLLRETGLLSQLLPEVDALAMCEQSPNYHPEGNVLEHVRLMLSHLSPDAEPILAWAVLLHDIAKPVTASPADPSGAIHFFGHERVGADMAREILSRLRFPRRQIEEVAAMVRHHMQFKDVRNMRKSTLRRLLMRKTFLIELDLHRLDCLGSHGRLDLHEFLVAEADALRRQPQILPPLLDGQDLIALGMKPGRRLGRMLAEVRERQLQDQLTTTGQAREWVRDQLKREGLDPSQPTWQIDS